MQIIEELQWRGLVQDVSDAEGIKRLGPDDAFYVGFDPTAPSLQLGNLVPIIVSMHLAKAGLRPIMLFGGATGAIGDPKKTAERQLLPRELIDRNVASQREKVIEIFQRQNLQAEFVDNYEWTSRMPVLDFLRDVGKHFTVNYMLAKEVVKARLDGEGISFTEFSYMLIQANDFLHLYQERNCRLQIGGSDQWGNITAGLELIRRRIQGEAFALSIPLLLDAEGRKFGKTESGTIWLNAAMSSPYRFHQFWLNVDDRDAGRYLRVFTFLPREEIAALEESLHREPEKRAAQHALADHVTTTVHGEQAAREAVRSAEVLFGGSIAGLQREQLEEIFSDVPSSSIPRDELGKMTFVNLLVRSGLVKSKGEARRLIGGGGAYCNNERVSDESLKGSDLQSHQLLILRTGKKNYHLVKVVQ